MLLLALPSLYYLSNSSAVVVCASGSDSRFEGVLIVLTLHTGVTSLLDYLAMIHSWPRKHQRLNTGHSGLAVLALDNTNVGC